MQEAETGMSNNERACFSGALANHLAYVQHRDFSLGQVPGHLLFPCDFAFALKAQEGPAGLLIKSDLILASFPCSLPITRQKQPQSCGGSVSP
jgi:hypothetical protein